MPRLSLKLRAVVVGTWACLALAGCHRKTESPAFTHASGAFNKLYAQELDSAFTDPKMGEIEAELRTVPDNSLDTNAAHALLARITDGRARVQREAEERAKLAATGAQPVQDFAFRNSAGSSAPSSAPVVRDGGGAAAPHPTAGMSVEEFNKRFGDCFGPAGPVNLTGQGLRDSYALKELQFCKDQHPGFDQQILLADGVTVLGSFPKSAMTRAYADGGKAP